MSLIFIDVGDMEFIWGDYEKSLGFEIYKANQLIFRSKESYRLQDFKSMAFDDGFNIILETGDMGTIIYEFSDNTWVLQE